MKYIQSDLSALRNLLYWFLFNWRNLIDAFIISGKLFKRVAEINVEEAFLNGH